jgi:hypothetical protein
MDTRTWHALTMKSHDQSPVDGWELSTDKLSQKQTVTQNPRQMQNPKNMPRRLQVTPRHTRKARA